MAFITKLATRMVLYGGLLLVLSFSSHQLDLVPSVIVQFTWALGLWMVIFVAMIGSLTILWRWLSDSDFCKLSIAGVAALLLILPIVVVLGPAKLSLASAKVTVSGARAQTHFMDSTFASDDMNFRQYSPIFIASEKTLVEEKIRSFALSEGWKLQQNKAEGELVYSFNSPWLGYRFQAHIIIDNLLGGSRVDLWIVALDQDNDFGYGYGVIEALDSYLNLSGE